MEVHYQWNDHDGNNGYWFDNFTPAELDAVAELGPLLVYLDTCHQVPIETKVQIWLDHESKPYIGMIPRSDDVKAIADAITARAKEIESSHQIYPPTTTMIRREILAHEQTIVGEDTPLGRKRLKNLKERVAELPLYHFDVASLHRLITELSQCLDTAFVDIEDQFLPHIHYVMAQVEGARLYRGMLPDTAEDSIDAEWESRLPEVVNQEIFENLVQDLREVFHDYFISQLGTEKNQHNLVAQHHKLENVLLEFQDQLGLTSEPAALVQPV